MNIFQLNNGRLDEISSVDVNDYDISYIEDCQKECGNENLDRPHQHKTFLALMRAEK